jgi:hypothetical protein
VRRTILNECSDTRQVIKAKKQRSSLAAIRENLQLNLSKQDQISAAAPPSATSSKVQKSVKARKHRRKPSLEDETPKIITSMHGIMLTA